MISPEYVKMMSKYNSWQNHSLVEQANGLDDSERKWDRGAFFGSIHNTFVHLLWGDMIWMHRFSNTPMPPVSSIGDSGDMLPEWDMFKQKRMAFDEEIEKWAATLDQNFLGGEMSWFSGALQKQVTKPVSGLVVHMFNHQTHHRGQLHSMLTAAGKNPDDTDLFICL